MRCVTVCARVSGARKAAATAAAVAQTPTAKPSHHARSYGAHSAACRGVRQASVVRGGARERLCCAPAGRCRVHTCVSTCAGQLLSVSSGAALRTAACAPRTTPPACVHAPHSDVRAQGRRDVRQRRTYGSGSGCDVCASFRASAGQSVGAWRAHTAALSAKARARATCTHSARRRHHTAPRGARAHKRGTARRGSCANFERECVAPGAMARQRAVGAPPTAALCHEVAHIEGRAGVGRRRRAQGYYAAARARARHSCLLCVCRRDTSRLSEENATCLWAHARRLRAMLPAPSEPHVAARSHNCVLSCDVHKGQSTLQSKFGIDPIHIPKKSRLILEIQSHSRVIPESSLTRSRLVSN
jgi:hypothetical protein